MNDTAFIIDLKLKIMIESTVKIDLVYNEK